MIKLESNPGKTPLNERSGWIDLRGMPTVSSSELEGERLDLELNGSAKVSIEFTAGGATVSTYIDNKASTYNCDQVDVVLARPGVTYYDLVESEGQRSVTVVKNDAGAVLVALHEFEERDGEPNVVQRVAAGSASGSSPELFEPSSDLVGKRAIVSYQEDHVLEHIYFNSRTFGWQLLQGENEVGHGEANRATTWKIADELYVLTWVENHPVGAFLLMDYAAQRNVGKIIAIDDFGFTNQPAGARIDYFGTEIVYPEGCRPS